MRTWVEKEDVTCPGKPGRMVTLNLNSGYVFVLERSQLWMLESKMKIIIIKVEGMARGCRLMHKYIDDVAINQNATEHAIYIFVLKLHALMHASLGRSLLPS